MTCGGSEAEVSSCGGILLFTISPSLPTCEGKLPSCVPCRHAPLRPPETSPAEDAVPRSGTLQVPPGPGNRMARKLLQRSAVTLIWSLLLSLLLLGAGFSGAMQVSASRSVLERARSRVLLRAGAASALE